MVKAAVWCGPLPEPNQITPPIPPNGLEHGLLLDELSSDLADSWLVGVFDARVRLTVNEFTIDTEDKPALHRNV